MKGAMHISDHIEEMYEEVTKILDKYNLQEDDKTTIKDILKEMAHQWVTSNASACAVEKITIEVVGQDKYDEIVKKFIHSGLMETIRQEQYPNYPGEK